MANEYIYVRHAGRHYFDCRDAPDIRDIAERLARINRWTGGTTFSVAQHSLLVSYLCPTLEALLHDATEAYLGDCAAPLKALLPDYQRIEAEHDKWIRNSFGLSLTSDPAVRHADLQSLALEKYYLLGNPEAERSWPDMSLRLDMIRFLQPAPIDDVVRKFLERFEELR